MVDIVDLLRQTPGFAGGTPLDELGLGAIRRQLGGMASGPISAVNQAATTLPPIPPPTVPQEESSLSALLGRLNTGLNSPLGRLGTNLLANSGPSLIPQSTLGNIGQALQQTQAQGRESSLDELQRRLVEARIGLAGAQGRAAETTAEAAGRTNTNVQSTFEGQNGNMFIVSRDGNVTDTGVPFNERLIPVTRPDGSVILVDPTRQAQVGDTIPGPATNSDQSSDRITEIVSPDEAITGASDLTRAQTEAQGDPERSRASPLQLEATRNKIGQIQQSLDDLASDELDTGPIQGRIAGLTAAGQRFQRVSGQAVIEAIGQATFGQLSEGERRFLEGTVANPLVDESVNQDALNEMLRILTKAQQIQERDVQESAERQGNELRSFEERGFTIQ